MANPAEVLSHIRAVAEAVALMSRNPQLNHAAVNAFCDWVEHLLRKHEEHEASKISLKKEKK